MTGVGEVLNGRYELLSLIGRGGMGEVFRGRDLVLDREVAVKLIAAGAGGDEPGVATSRLLREARSAARIRNPHVVTVHDAFAEGGDAFIVMEYVPAPSLAQVLKRDGRLPPARAARIGAQVAAALDAAHRLGVVHRDVKPANVLIEDGDLAKLTDFGVARGEDDPALTSTGSVIGSVAYMAPEVARGDAASAASDVYSLGATLFATTEGRPPYARENESSTAISMLTRLITEPAPPPVHAGTIGSMVARMLAADPAARPALAEVIDEFTRLGGGADGVRPVPDQTRVASPGTALTMPGSQEIEEPTRLRMPAGATADLARTQPADHWPREQQWSVTEQHTVARSPISPAPSPAGQTKGPSRSRLWIGIGAGVLAVAAIAAGAAVAVPALSAGNSQAPLPPAALSTPSVREAPASSASQPVAVTYTCWNDTEVDSLKACGTPSGRASLRYLYPSLNSRWSSCQFVQYQAGTQTYECSYGDEGTIRYRYWSKTSKAITHYTKKYAKGSSEQLLLDGHDVGTFFSSDQKIDGVYSSSGLWNGNHYSFSIDSPSPAIRDRLLNELQIRAFDQLAGHPSSEPATVGQRTP